MGVLFGGVVLLALIAAIALWWALRASLAQLDGHRAVSGLQARVRIERDNLGVPTIYATNRLDATRALGFLHAQERFFQMDLSRRAGAGELCELVGPMTLGRDRQARVHRPRAQAKRALELAPPNEVALLRAYAEGVNAGLDALGARPPEYLMLRAAPARWQTEDTYLVTYAIYAALHDIEGYDDYHEEVLRAALSPAALAFFDSPDIAWSAVLDGSTPSAPPIPSPQDLTFTNRGAQLGAALGGRASPRALTAIPPETSLGPRGRSPSQADESHEGEIGSNNWAVDGRRSGTGAAIVANDMHLALMVPNTWYRVRLIYSDPELGQQDIVGVTMPGAPAVVAGSNRYLAWALTASCLDTADLVKLELDPANPRRYRTPSGWQEFQRFAETIHVRGGTNVELAVAETIWGPVVKRGKTQFALACTLHDAQALNLRSIEMERARDTETVLRVSGLAGTPVLNLIVGDRSGNIGYSVLGRLPNRVGFDGSTPVSWADGTRGWRGWLAAADYPRLVNPTNGILWTANNRTLGSPDYNRLHIVSADNGARARQIRDDLLALDKPTEQTLWSIYHDDRALFLDRWQKLLLSVLAKGAPGKPGWQEAKDLVAAWGAEAAVGSQGYRLVRGFHTYALNLLFQPVNERLAQYDKAMRFSNEEAAWALVTARPPHLLNPSFSSYDELLEKAVELLLADLKARGIPLSQATWGSRNHLEIRHPLSQAVPQLSQWLGRWLDMPDAQVSGDSHMPKVHAGGFGVSERMIVSPGREEQGLYNMPGGQSGHFLSPFYRSEMEHWLKVEPQPLLPGPKSHELELRPAS
jgi:penicillin G amidase